MQDLQRVALLHFFVQEVPFFDVEVFLCRTFSGTPKASDEMVNPKKYPIANLPLDKMLPADRHWLPVIFDDTKNPLEWWFTYSEKPKDRSITLINSRHS
jgi:hypothetical protein